MKIGGGYDSFWGADPFRYIEPQKIVWEKPRKPAVSAEDEANFYGNVLKAAKPAFDNTGLFRRLDIKV